MKKTGIKAAGAVLGGMAALVAGGSYYLVRKAYSDNFGRWNLEKYSERLRYEDVKEEFPRRLVEFYSSDGRKHSRMNKIQGYVYGEDRTKGLVIFSHGILAAHEDYLPCILELVKRDWCVFAFDNTGTGNSEGKNSRGLVQGPLDLLAALRYVDSDDDLKDRRKVLYGHSQGGYSVCAVLNFYHDVEAIVSVSGFITPFSVTSGMGRDMYGKASVVTHPIIRFENRRLFHKYSNLSAVDGINKTDIPIHIMHGVGDDFVKYNGCSLIHHREEISNPNVSYQSLDYPERNDHGSFVWSLEANRYQKEIEKQVGEAVKRCGVKAKKELPEEELEKIFSQVDKKRACEPNSEFYDDVDAFYCRSLGL